VATLPEPDLLARILTDALTWAGVDHLDDLGDLRITRRGNLGFAFNYGPDAAEVPAPSTARFLIGERRLGPVDVAVWDEGG
jgi:beta-galactosidase